MENSETLIRSGSIRDWFSAAQLPDYFATAFLISLISPLISNMIGDLNGKIILLSVWLLFEIAINGLDGLIKVIRYRGKELFFLLSWLFVLMFYGFYEIGNMETWAVYIKSLVFFITAYTLGAMFFDNFQKYLGFQIIVFIVVCITAVLIVELLYREPFIVRMAADKNILTKGQLPIIGAISYFTGTSISTPFMIGTLTFLKEERCKFIFLACLLIPFILSIYLSTMAAPTFFVIFSVSGMLYLYYRHGIISKRISLAFALLVCIAIFASMTLSLKHGSFFKEKTLDIFSTASRGDYRQVERGSDAVKSIDTFLTYPFFGIGPKQRGFYREIGEHSTWIDALAEFGVVGFLPFLLFLYFAWKRIYREFHERPEQIFNQTRLVGFIIYMLAGLINPWGFDGFSAVFFAALVLGPSSTALNTTE